MAATNANATLPVEFLARIPSGDPTATINTHNGGDKTVRRTTFWSESAEVFWPAYRGKTCRCPRRSPSNTQSPWRFFDDNAMEDLRIAITWAKS